MTAQKAAAATAALQLPAVLSDTTGNSWDGSPLTRPVWLSTLPSLLDNDKSIRDLFEKGWVVSSSGKVAVQSAIHARYISTFPEIFFEWEEPAPPFTPGSYEIRRLKLMKTLDDWYASKSAGESPPFTLSFYDPAIPTTVPKPWADRCKDDAKLLDDTLTDAEKLRFIISPEVISATDSAAAVIIAKSITDTDLAAELSRRYNRSGRTILKAENLASKTDLSDEASSFLHQTADLLLRTGPSSVSVGAYNQMASQYLRLCRAVPDHLRRSDAVLADALATSVKKMGENISLKLEIAVALGQASRNLWKTQNVIRNVLSEIQLANAQGVLQSPYGLSRYHSSPLPRIPKILPLRKRSLNGKQE